MKYCSLPKIALLSLIVFVSAACGGGGGGKSSSGFYGGTWNFAGRIVVNDCNSQIPSETVVNLVVNQDGNRVVVNAGSVTLQGNTNNRDGFDVASASQSANGCETGTAIIFANASDGIADTGLAIVAQCGNLRCTASWGGESVRQNGKGYLAPSFDLVELESALVSSMNSQGNLQVRSYFEESDLVEEAIKVAKSQIK